MKRGLSKAEAAEYCGCKTIAAFDDWRRRGVLNVDPMPGTTIYDRRALDRALDRASGIVAESGGQEPSPFQKWKAARASKTEAA